MNFIKRIEKIRNEASESNIILTGINLLDENTKGVRGIISIAAAPKVGKTSFLLATYLCNLYLRYVESSIKLKWIYFSFEMPEDDIKARATAFFIHKFTGIKIPYSRILGEEIKDGAIVKLNDEEYELVKRYYEDYTEKMFEHILFIVERDNPTGVYKLVKNYMLNIGVEKTRKVEVKDSTINIFESYTPNDNNVKVLCIIDHIRHLRKERGFDNKELIDTMSRYEVELTNNYGVTFVNIIHINRNLSDSEMMKLQSTNLHPTSDMVKDTGNLSEDAHQLITLMKPTDPKYNLKSHFGKSLYEYKNRGYRTLHLVENRRGDTCHLGFTTDNSILAWDNVWSQNSE